MADKDNLVQMQHASKAPASFTQGDSSYDSDENGIISIPSQLTGLARSHGFSTDVAEKPTPKPLLKDAGKGGDGKKLVKSETDDAGKGGDGK